MPHFVYMLRCKGDRIYTGYAVDVQARYEEHCCGRGAKFTRAFPPECILRTFELSDYRYALRLEARIKKLKRAQKELLVVGDKTLEARRNTEKTCFKNPQRENSQTAGQGRERLMWSCLLLTLSLCTLVC